MSEESVYSCLFEDEYSESEDEEEILNFNKIPRHLCQRIRYNNPHIIEDSSESEEDEKIYPSSKVVIRHLPPELTGDIFFQLVSPLPAHDYKYFVEARKEFNENMYAAAYINFLSLENALLFLKQYNGHIFQCSKGGNYKAIVEFVPSAEVPKVLPSKDYICGTVDDDPDYLEFLETLKMKNAETPKKDDEVEKAASRTLIPLVDYVNTRRTEHVARGENKRPQKYYRNWW